MASKTVPELRVRAVNDRAIDESGDYVLYWMTAARRRRANFALQHAVQLSKQLDRPVVVLEALRCDYRWANDRLHTFVMQGMADNREDFARAGVTYHAYVEPKKGKGKGLLEALAKKACCVVTDDFPCFFLPRMVAAAGEKLAVRLDAVDGNGLLPMRVADKVFSRAFDFRRFLQKALPAHLADFPVGDPLRGYKRDPVALPATVTKRWPDTVPELSSLPIDHDVVPGCLQGGAVTAGKLLRRFLSERMANYEDRSHPDKDVASTLSAYLHFGHISAHQVFAGVASQEDWSRDRIKTIANGKRGWFGMSDGAEGFLDQITTWRELGYNYCWQRDDYEDYESLPNWVQETFAKHEGDARPHLYTLEQFAQSQTHDEVWNAAQRELRETGVLQNYLRMLWGKKILEWSMTARDAMATMIELNNRYALDGRNPNSYSGISWVLGRYDRPWAPEREIFGVVRFMSSANTVRKLCAKQYLARWGTA